MNALATVSTDGPADRRMQAHAANGCMRPFIPGWVLMRQADTWLKYVCQKSINAPVYRTP